MGIEPGTQERVGEENFHTKKERKQNVIIAWLSLVYVLLSPLLFHSLAYFTFTSCHLRIAILKRSKHFRINPGQNFDRTAIDIKVGDTPRVK